MPVSSPKTPPGSLAFLFLHLLEKALEAHGIDPCLRHHVEPIGIGLAFGIARIAQDGERPGKPAQRVAAGAAREHRQEHLEPGRADELRLGMAVDDMADLMSEDARHLVGRGRRLDEFAGYDDPPTRQREGIDDRQVVDADRKGGEIGIALLEAVLKTRKCGVAAALRALPGVGDERVLDLLAEAVAPGIGHEESQLLRRQCQRRIEEAGGR